MCELCVQKTNAMHTASKQVLTTLLILGAALPAITSAQTGPETFISLTVGPEASGSASFDCETDQFDLSSSSASITGGADTFQFVYRELTNDADVKARVRSNNASLAGLMIRSGSGSNTAFAMVGLSGGQTITRYRASMNAATTEGNSMSTASWIRIRRAVNSISSFSSSDGISWVLVESRTLNLGAQVLVGMAVVNGTTSYSDVAVIGTLEQIDVVDPGPVDPGPTETIPNAPSGLVATVASNTLVNLSWSDNSSDESGFRVERQTGTGNFQVIASPSAGTTSYSDSSVAESTTYTYRILGFNNAGTSGASNVQQVTIPGPTLPPVETIDAPTNLTGTVNSTSSISINWLEHEASDVDYRVERQKDGGIFIQVAEMAANIRTFQDTGLVSSTRYTYRVYAFSQNATSGYSNTASGVTLAPESTVNPIEPVDEVFSVNDIGAEIQDGTSLYDSENDVFRLSASGGQIWGTEDDFHYVYREITGDVETTVKVSSLIAGDEFGKAGIMFRESSDVDARHAFLTVSAGKGVAFERRLEAGGGTTRSGKGNVAAPIWLRLIKEGTYISAYYSEDGDNWSFLSEDIIDFSDTIFIGLAVAAHSVDDSVTADFGELDIVELSIESSTETFISADIGKVGVNGDAAYDSDSDTFIVQAAGGDIGAEDAFHYLFREVEGDFEAVAKIDSLVAEQNWAKAGLMVRDSFRPDAPYFALFMANNIGIVHQHRATFGGPVDWSKLDNVYATFWVKISRQGNLFVAYYSLDGSTWTLVNDATMVLPDTLLVGMAVTSHEEGALAFAEFSNVSITN